jgi:serine/threonine-protein kinase RsbW
MEPSLNARARYQIELVFEEIIGNIVRYGAPRGGELRVEVLVEISAGRILMTFEDDGIPFDPCATSGAAALRTLAEAPDGGFGLTIVRSVASSMRYERAADQNRLLVTLPAG